MIKRTRRKEKQDRDKLVDALLEEFKAETGKSSTPSGWRSPLVDVNDDRSGDRH